MLKNGESQNELNDAEYLVVLRRQMHKFALLQLADTESAEDAVREVLMSALKNQASFKSRASLKTWVFAILKNKIADILRQNKRFVFTDRLPEEIEGGRRRWIPGCFQQTGVLAERRTPLPMGKSTGLPSTCPILEGLRNMSGRASRKTGPRFHDEGIHRTGSGGNLLDCGYIQFKS